MKNKKAKWIVISVIILIVIIIGIILWRSDVFKSPRQLFEKYAYQNAKLLPEYDYNEMIKQLDKIGEEKYETIGNITFSVNSQYANDDNYNIKQVKEEIEKLKIDYNVKSIGKESKNTTDFIIKYDNNDLLRLKLLNNQDRYGIRYSDFYDKYLYIENNNLKQVAEKLGLDSTYIPDKIESMSLYDLLYIDNNELERIIKEYSSIVNEVINNEKFSSEKDVEINYNNEKIKTNKYTLNLTNKDLLDLYIKILEKLKNDDATLDIIIDKINKIGFYYSTEKLDKENLKIYMQEEIDKYTDYEIDEENFEIKVYEYKNKTIRTELKLENQDIIINLLDTNKDSLKAEILFNTQYGNQQKITLNKKVSDNSKNYNIEIMYYDGTTFDFDIESEQIKNTNNIYEVKNTFKLGNAQFNITINQEQKTDYNKDITIDDFDDENSVNLNNESSENIQRIFDEGITNLQNNISQKLELLGIDEESLQNIMGGNVDDGATYDYDDYYYYNESETVV